MSLNSNFEFTKRDKSTDRLMNRVTSMFFPWLLMGANVKPKKRRCLRCGKKFESTGIMNRLCKECNTLNRRLECLRRLMHVYPLADE